MTTLANLFDKSLQEISDVSDNSYLQLLRNAVKHISKYSKEDGVLSEYNKILLELISRKNFALDSKKVNEFTQVVGEAHFYLLCKEKGIDLNRIKENKNPTPDFVVKNSDICFEVKTLSVVSGDIGIKASLEDSYDTKLKIADKMDKGIIIEETVIQPYGNKPYKNGAGHISAVIDTLIEKSRQNVKLGQFPSNKSFLVVNLSVIPPFRTENFVLRPAYCDDYMFRKAVSGELWMMAFSNLEMPILGIPEFEGMPCVESFSKKVGILNEFDYIAGILFVLYPMNRRTEIWGLYKYESYLFWEKNEPDLIKILLSITGEKWNDSRDSNGWNLQGNTNN